MKILFVTTLNGWGGSEFLWALMAKVALQRGNEVEIICSKQVRNNVLIKELLTIGANIYFKKENYSNTTIGKVQYVINNKLPYLLGSYRNIAFSSIDCAVISQGGTYEACHDSNLFKKINQYNIPYYLISQYHDEKGVLNSYLYQKAKSIFKNAKQIFFVSSRNKLICETLLAIKLVNGLVINNPLRIDTFHVEYPDDKVVCFACVARLDVAIKCQNILLQMLSSDKWKERSWCLNFYGSGKDLSYLQDLVQQCGLTGKVFFHGHVSDIRSIWENNHLLLLPSSSEGCALSLIEAFGCRRIAVVTDVGGHEDLIIEGETGFLASSFSGKNFDKALEKAWQKKEQWQLMGEKAYKHLQNIFDLNIEETLIKKLESDNNS